MCMYKGESRRGSFLKKAVLRIRSSGQSTCEYGLETNKEGLAFEPALLTRVVPSWLIQARTLDEARVAERVLHIGHLLRLK
jgi:hypothetical protein